jgi:hypothetical protein
MARHHSCLHNSNSRTNWFSSVWVVKVEIESPSRDPSVWLRSMLDARGLRLLFHTFIPEL